jgi:hypothetical protein
MARINVSVRDDLKERMSALDHKVNWSEVAQSAFEREVSARTVSGDDMEQVIERLRASKASFEERERTAGVEFGQRFAKRSASYEHLRAIAELRLVGIPPRAGDVDRALGLKVLDPRESFWREGGELKVPSDEYVKGFVDGASDVWAEVVDKL